MQDQKKLENELKSKYEDLERELRGLYQHRLSEVGQLRSLEQIRMRKMLEQRQELNNEIKQLKIKVTAELAQDAYVRKERQLVIMETIENQIN